MRPGKVKEVGLDIVADIVGSFFIAVGCPIEMTAWPP